MRQKLYDIKLILRIVISLFVVISMVKSCAKAVSFEDFRQAVSDKADEYPSNNYFKSAKNFMNSSPLYNYLLSNELFYLFEDYDTIVFGCSESGTSYGRIYFMNPVNNFEFNGNYLKFSSQNYKKLSMFYSGGVGPWQQFSLSDMTNQTQFQYTKGTGYNNTLYMIYTDKGFVENTLSNAYNYLVTLDISTFFLDNNYSDVTVDGSQFIALPINYRSSYTYIGNIQGIVSSMHYINLNLSQVNGSWQEKDTYFVDSNYNTNSNFYITNDYDIYISTRLLNSGLKLVLYIDAFSDSSFTDLINYTSVNFYSVYYNATISGDSIINLGSGDYNTQDSTNAILGFLGNAPSGDDDFGTGFLGGIMKGIKNLFVPDAAYFSNYFSELNTFFSDRLGILYFPIEFLLDFLNRVLTIDFSNPVMTLGPYTMPLNDDFELVPQITFNFNDYLLENNLKQIHDVYLVIVDGLLGLGLLQLIRKTYENIVNNREA